MEKSDALGHQNAGRLLGLLAFPLNEDEKNSTYLLSLWSLNGLVLKIPWNST